jgi:hypothetical protein
MAPIALGYEFLINGVVYFPAGMFFLSESGDDVVLQGSLIGYAVYLVFAVIGVLFRKMSFFWCFLCILFVNYFGCLTRVLSDPR